MKKFFKVGLPIIAVVIAIIVGVALYNQSAKESEHKHTLVYHSAVSATCTTDGNVEYWSCKGCGKYFGDKNAGSVITEITIPKAHTGGTEIRDEIAPTIESKGYTGDTYCLGCGQKIADGKDIDKLDHVHNMKKTDRVESTCTENGNIEYYTCLICDKLYKDIEGKWEINIEQTVIIASHNLTYHAQVNATCTENGTIAHYQCERCNKRFSDTLGTKEIHDIEIIAKHSLTFNAKINESCTENGTVAHYHCSKCNNNYEDSEANKQITKIIIDATHILTRHTKVNATCTENGTKEYWSCSRCDKNFSDSNGINEIIDLVILAGHVYGDDDICDVCGEGATLNKEYRRVDNDGTENPNGEYLLFGAYPQTDVTSSMGSILSEYQGSLPTSSALNGWTDYGYYISGRVQSYMWYKDVSYNGEKYRAVYFTQYRPRAWTSDGTVGNSDQSDNGYNTKNVYWFKFEPIRWRILNESGGKALLLSEMIIDSQAYQDCIVRDGASYHASDNQGNILTDGNGNRIYSNNYAYSTIRAWLNDNFYKTAFSSEQQQIIETTTVDNSVTSTLYSSNYFACEDTQDKVFLMSAKEMTTAEYGFSTSTEISESRKKQNTDYAKVQGNINYYGNVGVFLLRSPKNNDTRIVLGVNDDGYVYGNFGSNNTNHGIVPALQIQL